MRTIQSLWIIAAVGLFSVMGVCVKYAAFHMTTLELVFFRSLLGCGLMMTIARWRWKSLRTNNFATHCERGIAGFLALFFFFYAVQYLSLSTALALLQTSPLYLALFHAVSMRKLPPSMQTVALLLCFAGMLFVLQPGMSDLPPNGAIAAVAAGFCAGWAYFSIRKLGILNEGGIRTVFYFTLIATIISATLILLTGEWTPLTPAKLGWGLALGATATAGQLMLTRGLHYGETIVSSALMYSGILFSGLFDYLLWRSAPDAIAWLGIVLIVGAGCFSIWINHRQRRSRADSKPASPV